MSGIDINQSLHNITNVLSTTNNVLNKIDIHTNGMDDEYTDAFNMSAVDDHSVHESMDPITAVPITSTTQYNDTGTQSNNDINDKENEQNNANVQHNPPKSMLNNKLYKPYIGSMMDQSINDITNRYKFNNNFTSTMPYNGSSNNILSNSRQFSYNSIPLSTRHRSHSSAGISIRQYTPIRPNTIQSNEVLNMSHTYDITSSPVVPSYDTLYNNITQFKHKLRTDFDSSIQNIKQQLKSNKNDLQQHTIQLIDNIEISFAHKIKNVVNEYSAIQLEYKQYVKNELYQLNRIINECKHTYDMKYTELNNKYSLMDKLYLQSTQQSTIPSNSLPQQIDLASIYKQLDTHKHTIQQSIAQYVQSNETRLIDINTHILELRKIIESILDNESITLQQRDQTLNSELVKIRSFVQGEIDSTLSNTYTLIKSLKRQLDDRDIQINKLMESVDTMKLERQYGTTAGTATPIDQSSIQHLLQRISSVESKQSHSQMDDTLIQQLTQSIHKSISDKLHQQTEQRESEWNKQWELQQLEIQSLRQSLIRAGVAVENDGVSDMSKHVNQLQQTVNNITTRIESIDQRTLNDSQKTVSSLSQLAQQHNELNHTINTLSGQHTSTSNTIRQLTISHDELQHQVTAIGSDSTLALSQCKQSASSIDQLHNTTTNLSTTLNSTLQQHKQYIDDLHQSISSHSDKLHQLDARMDTHGETVVAVSHKIDSIQSQPQSQPLKQTDIIVSELQSQLQLHTNEISRLTSQLQEQADHALNLTQINESHVDTITDKLNTTSDTYQTALKQHGHTVDKLHSTVEQLQQQLSQVTISHTESLQQHSDTVHMQLNHLKAQIGSTNCNNNDTGSAAQYDVLTEQMNTLQSELNAVKQSIASLATHHESSLAEHETDIDHRLTALSSRLDTLDMSHNDYKQYNDTQLQQLKLSSTAVISPVVPVSPTDSVSTLQVDILTKHLNSLQSDLTKLQQSVQQQSTATTHSISDINNNISELTNVSQAHNKLIQAVESTLSALHVDIDSNYEHTQQGFNQCILDLRSLSDKVHALQSESGTCTSHLPETSPALQHHTLNATPTQPHSTTDSHPFAKPVLLSRTNSLAGNQHVAVTLATNNIHIPSPAAKQAQAATAQRLLDASEDSSEDNNIDHIQFDTEHNNITQSNMSISTLSAAQLPPLHIRDNSDESMFHLHSPIHIMNSTNIQPMIGTVPSTNQTPIKHIDHHINNQSSTVHNIHIDINKPNVQSQHNSTQQHSTANITPKPISSVSVRQANALDTDLSLSMGSNNESNDMSEFTFGSPAPVTQSIQPTAVTSVSIVKQPTPHTGSKSMFSAFGIDDSEHEADMKQSVVESVPVSTSTTAHHPLSTNQLSVDTVDHHTPTIKTPTFNTAAQPVFHTKLNNTSSLYSVRTTDNVTIKHPDLSLSEQFVSELDDLDFSIADADLSYKD